MSLQERYHAFLERKVVVDRGHGFPCEPEDVNPVMKPHARDIVCWGVPGGRRLICSSFGMQKSTTGLETVRIVLEKSKAPYGLIVIPLGVRQEFMRDARCLNTGTFPTTTDEQRRQLAQWQEGRPDRILNPRFIQDTAEFDEPGIYITNYDSIRAGKLDPSKLGTVWLDEGDILRGCFYGTETYGVLNDLFQGSCMPRYVASATPAPNDYMELLAPAQWLGIMDIGQARTRFFRRNSEKAHDLSLHPHKEREFWLWVSTWAIFLQKPSDLNPGYSDEGYELPPFQFFWHELPTDHTDAGITKAGQYKMLKDATLGISEGAKEKRDSLAARIAGLKEVRDAEPDEHWIYCHHLEDERRAIEKTFPESVSVYGAQKLAVREKNILEFGEGMIKELAAKPSMMAGWNSQRHCARMAFLGVDFKTKDFLQAVHRVLRFGQEREVHFHAWYTEAERAQREKIERCWREHNELYHTLTDIIKEFGLSHTEISASLKRSIGIERKEFGSKLFLLICNDSVLETARMGTNSVHHINMSIPFQGQYEYTYLYNDFGHTESTENFFEQMDFLTPNLFRVLQPGRVMAVHVKDRVVHGKMSGQGYQTIDPFHCRYIEHAIKHGFAYVGMITVATDVVRENKGTNRLGWTRQCQDGSRMGVGLPEYVLLFRKPPTSTKKGWGDVRVVKNKKEYSRARWQIDANAFWRSDGNRLLSPAEYRRMSLKRVYRDFREYSKLAPYNYDRHVEIGETLDEGNRLRRDFAMIPPHIDHEDVWTDIPRFSTLNTSQGLRRKEKHICPLPFDIVKRLINRFTNPGDIVYDPYSGLGTAPMCAVELGRIGIGCDLNEMSWRDSIGYLRAAEAKIDIPTLFDFDDDGEDAILDEVPEEIAS